MTDGERYASELPALERRLYTATTRGHIAALNHNSKAAQAWHNLACELRYRIVAGEAWLRAEHKREVA